MNQEANHIQAFMQLKQSLERFGAVIESEHIGTGHDCFYDLGRSLLREYVERMRWPTGNALVEAKDTQPCVLFSASSLDSIDKIHKAVFAVRKEKNIAAPWYLLTLYRSNKPFDAQWILENFWFKLRLEPSCSTLTSASHLLALNKLVNALNAELIKPTTVDSELAVTATE